MIKSQLRFAFKIMKDQYIREKKEMIRKIEKLIGVSWDQPSFKVKLLVFSTFKELMHEKREATIKKIEAGIKLTSKVERAFRLNIKFVFKLIQSHIDLKENYAKMQKNIRKRMLKKLFFSFRFALFKSKNDRKKMGIGIRNLTTVLNRNFFLQKIQAFTAIKTEAFIERIVDMSYDEKAMPPLSIKSGTSTPKTKHSPRVASIFAANKPPSSIISLDEYIQDSPKKEVVAESPVAKSNKNPPPKAGPGGKMLVRSNTMSIQHLQPQSPQFTKEDLKKAMNGYSSPRTVPKKDNTSKTLIDLSEDYLTSKVIPSNTDLDSFRLGQSQMKGNEVDQSFSKKSEESLSLNTSIVLEKNTKPSPKQPQKKPPLSRSFTTVLK